MLEAFGALRAACAGLLVAAKRDRIARDMVVAATVEQMARDAGARVVTADGVAVENTPEGMLLRGLMDLFAQVRARGHPRPHTRCPGRQTLEGRAIHPSGAAGLPLRGRPARGGLRRARHARPRARHEAAWHLHGPRGDDPQRRGPPVPGRLWHVSRLARALRRAA